MLIHPAGSKQTPRFKSQREVFQCEQRSPEWYQLRLGIPTASMFKVLRRDADSKTRDEYMRRLAGEIVTGEPMRHYSNEYMERGIAMEPEALTAYCLLKDIDVEQVGFIRNGRMGCSPDGLYGQSRAVEIKTQEPHLLIQRLMNLGVDTFPSEYMPQCQGTLMVAELESVDLVIYWPGMPLFIRTAYRLENEIKRLRFQVDQFNEELDRMVQKVRSF